MSAPDIPVHGVASMMATHTICGTRIKDRTETDTRPAKVTCPSCAAEIEGEGMAHLMREFYTERRRRERTTEGMRI